MEEIYRDYQDIDYNQCEELVNQAWKFDEIFAPEEFSDLAKQLYTKGSVISSNYKVVVEVDGKVAGFIFGFNERATKPGLNILYRLKTLWKLLRIKAIKPVNRSDFMNILKHHEINRNKVVKRGKSEINLFVVDKSYQTKGFGKNLWKGFLDYCKDSGVESIIVETNKLGASGFYERIGFKHLGNFDSPLHELATKGGQACMYEFVEERFARDSDKRAVDLGA